MQLLQKKKIIVIKNKRRKYEGEVIQLYCNFGMDIRNPKKFTKYNIKLFKTNEYVRRKENFF